MEIWRTIKTNPRYEVSNKGRIRNRDTQMVLTPTKHYRYGRFEPREYLRIELKNPRRKYLVHRLVAEEFLPNPLNLPHINHRDENGLNNTVDNIEWCTHKYNVRYSQLKPVLQLDKNDVLIARHPSLTDAAINTSSDIRLISAVCLGKRSSHNGFHWRYERKIDLIKKRRRVVKKTIIQ